MYKIALDYLWLSNVALATFNENYHTKRIPIGRRVDFVLYKFSRENSNILFILPKINFGISYKLFFFFNFYGNINENINIYPYNS